MYIAFKPFSARTESLQQEMPEHAKNKSLFSLLLQEQTESGLFSLLSSAFYMHGNHEMEIPFWKKIKHYMGLIFKLALPFENQVWMKLEQNIMNGKTHLLREANVNSLCAE